MHTTQQFLVCLEGKFFLLEFYLDYDYYSIHKIVGISIISRSIHSVSQTRELVCSNIVSPQVIDLGKYFERNKYTYIRTPKLRVG